MTLDLSRCRLTPFQHQVVGIEKIVSTPIVGIFDEMGSGKTFQVITAAQVLFEQNVIDRVLVIAPNSVRTVWYDPDFGELAKHVWAGMPVHVREFRAQLRSWGEVDRKQRWLEFMVTNYEFIRSKNRLQQLLPYCTPRTLLVLDESSSVKSHRAQQTMACLQLRKLCGRVVLLNGTPVANNPGDMFSQGNIMSPKILECKNWYHFRARYGILGGWQQKQIVAWRDIEDIQRRFAPYVLRRLKKDCLDLPDKIPPVVLSVPLTESSWRQYKAMRDDMVAWLTSHTMSSASQAIVKVMRLSQITSGFLGGVEEFSLADADPTHLTAEPAAQRVLKPVEEIGREKLDFLFSWLDDRLDADPNFKVVLWSRFKPELARAVRECKHRYPHASIGIVAGGYKKEEREYALRLLDPRTAPAGPAFIFGNPQSGGLGLNMTAANYMFRISNDYSHFKRAQSDDRIHRPGQTQPTNYFDLVATGPQGQKTIDHTVLTALMNKEDLATMTTSAWVTALSQE